MGCHQAEAVFLSFTVDSAVAEGVLTFQTAMKEAEFSLLRLEGFEVRVLLRRRFKGSISLGAT